MWRYSLCQGRPLPAEPENNPFVNNSKKTVRMISLGCPKNLVDSEVMLGLLREKGWVPSAKDEADVIIINTCSFIREAKEESIANILAMAEAKEKGKCRRLVVTGCLPQRYGQELLKELPEVDLFLGTGELHHIGDLLENSKEGRLSRKQIIGLPAYLYDHRTPRLLTSTPGSVYIKIAEGCSNHCSYCIIPQIRGKLRSRKISSVLQEVRQVVSGGMKEINLIAQDITVFGQDLGGGTDLTRLLRGLVKIKGLLWIRLLYAHPGHVTPELIRLIREEEKICKYLDLPLQHIDDQLLGAMNRPVSSSQVRELIARLRAEIPGITLRTSLMVGFPGETERRFRRLLDFVKEAEFEHLGVFRYSKEEGTPAAALKGHVSEKVKEQRYHQIMRLQRQISLRQQRKKIGTHMPVLIERPGKSSGILWEGRTQGQAPEVDGITFLRQGSVRPGEIFEAVITEATAYDLFGEIVGPA
ncbi:MAG: 30S ribosomal protein S12 methylthiotransferase RimO [Deltaproteobacteria bacterium]|nr:30S ribosomal protein S12 methylthiotransferase RimO [Deltaproteobacteria bacterium]